MILNWLVFVCDCMVSFCLFSTFFSASYFFSPLNVTSIDYFVYRMTACFQVLLLFFLNERFIYACCWVIISWQISGVIAELNLILSLLTHINAYPCTICNAQKDNLFTLKHDGKKSAAQQRSWFTDDECFGFMTLNRAQINKWHQMSRRATESEHTVGTNIGVQLLEILDAFGCLITASVLENMWDANETINRNECKLETNHEQ